MPQTPRLSLPYPDLDNAANIPADIQALAVASDNLIPGDQGILSNRPVSTAGSPGIKGRRYTVIGDPTPSNNGIEWYDYGTGWIAVGFYQAWTPQLGGLVGGAVSIGNGTIAGRFVLIGKTCNFTFAATIGSTTGVGSGIGYVTTPLPAGAGVPSGLPIGPATFVDASDSNHVYPLTVTYHDSSVVLYGPGPAGSSAWSSAVPVAQGAGDTLFGSATYEVA